MGKAGRIKTWSTVDHRLWQADRTDLLFSGHSFRFNTKGKPFVECLFNSPPVRELPRVERTQRRVFLLCHRHHLNRFPHITAHGRAPDLGLIFDS
jgi:hypothetical protein